MKIISKHLAYVILAASFVTLLAVTACVGQEPEPNEKSSETQGETAKGEPRATWALKNKEEAIARTRRIVGLSDDSSLPQLSVELVTLAEDNTPFLSDQIVGRPVWRVVIANWKLKLRSAPRDAQDSYARTFDLFVDPRAGNLLKLVSRWPEGVTAVKTGPGALSGTEQMRRSGDEKYHGFPKDDPPLTFLQAVDVVYSQGVGNPLVAKQIAAHYVLQSRMGGDPRPVWVVTLRGIPPLDLPTPPAGGPIHSVNHIREVIDALTGEWVFASTTPQPEG